MTDGTVTESLTACSMTLHVIHFEYFAMEIEKTKNTFCKSEIC